MIPVTFFSPKVADFKQQHVVINLCFMLGGTAVKPGVYCLHHSSGIKVKKTMLAVLEGIKDLPM